MIIHFRRLDQVRHGRYSRTRGVARARFPEVLDDRLCCLQVAHVHLLRRRFAQPFRSQAATPR